MQHAMLRAAPTLSCFSLAPRTRSVHTFSRFLTCRRRVEQRLGFTQSVESLDWTRSGHTISRFLTCRAQEGGQYSWDHIKAAGQRGGTEGSSRSVPLTAHPGAGSESLARVEDPALRAHSDPGPGLRQGHERPAHHGSRTTLGCMHAALHAALQGDICKQMFAIIMSAGGPHLGGGQGDADAVHGGSLPLLARTGAVFGASMIMNGGGADGFRAGGRAGWGWPGWLGQHYGAVWCCSQACRQSVDGNGGSALPHAHGRQRRKAASTPTAQTAGISRAQQCPTAPHRTCGLDISAHGGARVRWPANSECESSQAGQPAAAAACGGGVCRCAPCPPARAAAAAQSEIQPSGSVALPRAASRAVIGSHSTASAMHARPGGLPALQQAARSTVQACLGGREWRGGSLWLE